MPVAVMLILAVLSSVPGGFTALESEPSEDDKFCANHSDDWWTVATPEGKLIVARHATSRRFDPLPFEKGRRPKESWSERHVLQVADGWLAGWDGGEWGGGLWWHDSNGRFSYRFGAENVQGFAHFGDETLVFTGLGHLELRRGSISRVQKIDGRWRLSEFAKLDASPDAWIVEPNRVLVITASGLWEATGTAPARQLAPLGIDILAATSLVRGDDGALYIGMRRFVLRLEYGTWKQTWLVPSNCVKASYRNFDCVCER